MAELRDFTPRRRGLEEQSRPSRRRGHRGPLRVLVPCGHLGDVFADGFLFPGTRAAESGKRFCIDGGALVFRAEDGSEPIAGEAPAAKPVELPSWLQPPKVGGGKRERIDLNNVLFCLFVSFTRGFLAPAQWPMRVPRGGLEAEDRASLTARGGPPRTRSHRSRVTVQLSHALGHVCAI